MLGTSTSMLWSSVKRRRRIKFIVTCVLRMIVGSAYECEQRKCKFSMHRSCSKFPREIEHPFHPQHPLTFLADDSDKFQCSACGGTGWGFIYHCSDSECEFNLDVVCASLTTTTTTTKDYPSHPHPLIICDKNEKYSPVLCSACDLPLEDLINVCFECKCLLHESCTNFAEEIKHPFHPQHPLVLLPGPPYATGMFGCNACRSASTAFLYHCSQCEFDLDVHCAQLMVVTEPDHDHDQEHYLSHHHPVFHCNNETDLQFHCNACNLPLEDSFYVCIPCQNLLHKSCAELPQQLQHPFHRMHPLTLRKTSQRIPCRACRNLTCGFSYACFKCRFQVHTKCGWPIPPFINSECHNHPLAFLNIEAERLLCNSCQKQCNSSTGFFGCVECSFNLHVHCYPKLPPTIKHESHLHPLNLIKDHPDEEFHCSVCEEKRDISHPTYYYCAECHYIAHVHCVVSEVVHLLEEEWSLACKLGDTKLDTPTNVLKENTTDEMVRDISGSSLIELDDAEIEEVETETERLRTEVEVEQAKLETLKTELEAQEAKVTMLKTKLKALEVKHAQH